MKKCPYCAEEIQDDAVKCRYCQSSVEQVSKKENIKMNSTQVRSDDVDVGQVKNNNFQDKENKPKKSNNRLALFILIAVLSPVWVSILVIIIMSVVIFWQITVPIAIGVVLYRILRKTTMNKRNVIRVTASVYVILASIGAIYGYTQWKAPTLIISEPTNEETVNARVINIKGTVEPHCNLKINGKSVTCDGNRFISTVMLPKEVNTFTVEATNYGKDVKQVININRTFTEEEKIARAKQLAEKRKLEEEKQAEAQRKKEISTELKAQEAKRAVEQKQEEADILAARNCSQRHVKNMLKAPSTAKFQNKFYFDVVKLKKGQYQVKGYVDAENSFGANLRNHFTCIANVDPTDESCTVECTLQ